MAEGDKGTIEKVSEAMGKGGIPFGWASLFVVLILAAIYLGSWLTIKGQEQIRNMTPIQQTPAPVVSPQTVPTPVGQVQDPTDLGRVADNLNKTSQNVGNLADNVGGLNQNVGGLVKDFDMKMRKVDDELSRVSQSVNSMKDLQKSITELQEALKKSPSGPSRDPELAAKIESLSKSLDGKKFEDIAMVRKDLNTVNQNVVMLATVVKEKFKSPDEIKLNNLGEEFPRK